MSYYPFLWSERTLIKFDMFAPYETALFLKILKSKARFIFLLKSLKKKAEYLFKHKVEEFEIRIKLIEIGRLG